jgi:transposase
MIRANFLSEEDRNELIALARDGSIASRVTRRANALVLLDEGMSCQEVAHVLLYDDDTIRGWRKLFEQRGIEGITSFDVGGSASYLSVQQEDYLKAWVGAALPRSTRQIGAWIEKEFGLVYESRSGLIALLHRLGLEYHKPHVIPAKLDEDKQKAFIEDYEKLLNSLGDDEAVLFADAVHPTHAARSAGCWAPKQEKIAIEQTSGRERINIHGAIELATGQTRMIEVITVDAISTIRLLESIEAFYPLLVASMSFLTTRAITMPSWCRNGSPGPGVGSNCISSRPIARISIRSSGCGASCTETSRTTNATQLAPYSPMRRLVSYAKQFPGTGPPSVIRSPTIFASSTQRNFGL